MQLYQHQIDVLEATKDLNKVGYFLDMGLGKTFVASEKMMQLGEKLNLVICQKSKVQDWIDHFTEYYEVSVLDLTKPNAVKNWFNRNGIFLGDEPQVLVINYDLLWRRPELQRLRDFTLICDESGLLMHETTKRTKAVMKLNFKNILLLSGTICGGRYENLWSQLHLLGWTITKQMYWNQFINVEYLDMLDRSIPIVTGYKNVDRLKRKMKRYGCQFLKTDEVFDLPTQNFQKVFVPTSNEYRKFRKNKIVTFEDPYDHENGYTLVGDTTLTRMLYERQLCGIYSEEKLKAFQDLVESTEDRLIVFYNFTEELNRLQTAVMSIGRPISVMNGFRKDLKNYEEKSDSVTFVQYQAGAMGLNLQKACRMVFYSLPLSSELFEQAKKRIHRINQTKPCFYYLMICKGSIEERILSTLEMRKDFTEKLFERWEE